MPRFQLRVRALPHGELLDDEEDGRRLRELVTRAVEQGGAPLVAVVLRADRLEIVDLPDPKQEMTVPWLLAGLSRSELDGVGAVRAVGLMGVVDRRKPGASAPSWMALAFLEWSDCRWWCWRAAVDPVEGAVVEEGQVVTRAIDGDPLPGNLGRWWSLGRRRKLRVRLSTGPQDTTQKAGIPPLVH